MNRRGGRPLALLASALASLLVSVGPASAATLRGRVLGPTGSPLQNAVVYVDGLRAGEPPRRHPTLDQRHRTFIPHVMAVLLGTTVNFPNNDTVFHNVFSVREGKRFDLGLYPAGSHREVKFDRLGLVRIFCNIHSNMSAYIWTLPNPYFAVTDRQGRYKIEGAPAGTLKIRAWQENSQPAEQSLTATASGNHTLDFRLKAR